MFQKHVFPLRAFIIGLRQIKDGVIVQLRLASCSCLIHVKQMNDTFPRSLGPN